MIGPVYISGPMAGYPEHNYPAFHAAAADLESRGSFLVVNPATLHGPGEHTREDCLRRDIAALCRCSTIYMLDGWSKSEGAKLEYAVAKAIGCDVVFSTQSAEEELEYGTVLRTHTAERKSCL